MLKITPYLGIIVLIVSIGGIFYPKLGYFLLLVFATLMIMAPPGADGSVVTYARAAALWTSGFRP
jgi:hypothetical protein